MRDLGIERMNGHAFCTQIPHIDAHVILLPAICLINIHYQSKYSIVCIIKCKFLLFIYSNILRLSVNRCQQASIPSILIDMLFCNKNLIAIILLFATFHVRPEKAMKGRVRLTSTNVPFDSNR